MILDDSSTLEVGAVKADVRAPAWAL